MSGKATGYGKIDVKAVNNSQHAEDSNIEHAKELTAFAEAIVKRDPACITTTREALIKAVGVSGMIDACGTAANFQRMTRIADCSGIPLDEEFKSVTKSVVDKLGMDEYTTAANTGEMSTAQKLKALIMPAMLSVVAFVIRIKNQSKKAR